MEARSSQDRWVSSRGSRGRVTLSSTGPAERLLGVKRELSLIPRSMPRTGVNWTVPGLPVGGTLLIWWWNWSCNKKEEKHYTDGQKWNQFQKTHLTSKEVRTFKQVTLFKMEWTGFPHHHCKCWGRGHKIVSLGCGRRDHWTLGEDGTNTP